jgi:hypothetical protein
LGALALALLVLIGAPAHDRRGRDNGQNGKTDEVAAVFFPELRQVIAAQFFVDFPKDIAQCKSIWAGVANIAVWGGRRKRLPAGKCWISPAKWEKLGAKKMTSPLAASP